MNTRARPVAVLASLLCSLALVPVARAQSPDGGTPDGGTATPTPAEPAEPAEPTRPSSGPAKVTVGVYVNSVRGMSLRDNQYEIDFWVWFRWQAGADVNPIESFEIVGGQIDDKESVVEEDLDGGVKYAAARIRATINQTFDVARFPLDDHTLLLRIEDAEHETHELVFEPDSANSTVDPTVDVAGWGVTGSDTAVKDHTYRSNYGDTSLPSNSEATYAQFVFSIQLERQGNGYALKLFWALYLATLIALLAFFIKPTDLDPRFGLGIGAVFAAMASAYVISTSLPDTSQMTTADKVVMSAIGYIFLSLALSTVSLRVYATNEAGSKKIDTGSFWGLLVTYAALNVWLVL
jgi:hypothetical protein